MLRKKRKKEVVKLGVLEGEDNNSLCWKSKNKALSWDFAYYMPILLRDALRELVRDLAGCPSWLVDDCGNDVDAACTEWRRRIKGIADKLDYASKVSHATDFLSQEDKDTLDSYFAQECRPVFRKTENGQIISTLPPIPDYINEILRKEDKIAEDMHTKLKEALQELGEIWYNLWD